MVDSYTGLDISEKISEREYVYGRAIYYNLAEWLTKHSITSIARFVNRNHATLINSRKHIAEIEQYEPDFNRIHKELIELLKVPQTPFIIKSVDLISQCKNPS